MQNQNNITLHLTLDEVNTILSALGEQPYIKVFQLVQKVQAQAGGQLGGGVNTHAADMANGQQQD